VAADIEVVLKNENVRERKTEKFHSVYIRSVNDNRSDSIIGQSLNSLGVPGRNVITQTDIKQWVKKELTERLQKRGYTLLDNTKDSLEAIDLSVSIVKMYSVVKNTYKAEICFVAIVKYGGRELINKLYTGKEQGENVRLLTSSFYNALFNKTLKKAVLALEKDLDVLDKSLLASVASLPAKKESIPEVSQSTDNNDMNISVAAAFNAVDTANKVSHTCVRTDGNLQIIHGGGDSALIADALKPSLEIIRNKYKMLLEITPECKGFVCVYLKTDESGNTDSVTILKSELKNYYFEKNITSIIGETNFKGYPESTTKPIECIYSFELTPESDK
jgi:hypothetical protein